MQAPGGGASPWYRLCLAWLRGLRQLRVLTVDDLIVVDRQGLVNLRATLHTLPPGEATTDWKWLERLVATVEAVRAEGGWPALRNFTAGVMWTAKQVAPPPLGSWEAYDAAVAAGHIDPHQRLMGAGVGTIVPEPDRSLMPRLLRALPPLLRLLNLGRWLSPDPVLRALRCLGDGSAALPGLETLTLHFYITPDCLAALQAALQSPATCLSRRSGG